MQRHDETPQQPSDSSFNPVWREICFPVEILKIEWRMLHGISALAGGYDTEGRYTTTAHFNGDCLVDLRMMDQLVYLIRRISDSFHDVIPFRNPLPDDGRTSIYWFYDSGLQYREPYVAVGSDDWQGLYRNLIRACRREVPREILVWTHGRPWDSRGGLPIDIGPSEIWRG